MISLGQRGPWVYIIRLSFYSACRFILYKGEQLRADCTTCLRRQITWYISLVHFFPPCHCFCSSQVHFFFFFFSVGDWERCNCWFMILCGIPLWRYPTHVCYPSLIETGAGVEDCTMRLISCLFFCLYPRDLGLVSVCRYNSCTLHVGTLCNNILADCISLQLNLVHSMSLLYPCSFMHIMHEETWSFTCFIF